MKGVFYSRLLVIISLFLQASYHMHAGEPQMQFDEKRWKEMTEGVDYTENYKERKPEPETKQEEHGKGISTSVFGGLRYVFYILLVGGIIILAVRLINSMLENPEVKPEIEAESVSLEAAEDNLHETDLERLLSQALGARDFRLALRVKFLMLIKLLSEKGKITWAREKTNWEYYGELREKLLADNFREIILNFERCWYGEWTPDEQYYQRSLPAYQEMQNKLRA